MMTFVVSGATGFLGRRFCLDILAMRARVIAVGRNKAALNYLACFGASTVEADITHPSASKRIANIAGSDIVAVVHCAALTSHHGSFDAHWNANVVSAAQMMQVAVDCNAQRFVQVSTPSVLAEMADRTMVREDAPLPRGLNAYARSKAIAEKMVQDSLPDRSIILRPRGIYGKGDTALLPKLLKAAQRGPLPLFGDGRAQTNLTHVEDVSRALLRACEAPDSICGRTYHIANPEPLEIRQIIERVAEASGIEVSWRRIPRPVGRAMAEVMDFADRITGHQLEPPLTRYLFALFAYSNTLDVTAAAKELGWSPTISFSEGLSKTFKDDKASHLRDKDLHG